MIRDFETVGECDEEDAPEEDLALIRAIEEGAGEEIVDEREVFEIFRPAQTSRVQARMAPMIRDFNVIIERDTEGYYVATVPALKGCHTQARSLDKLMQRVREAIELCLEVEGEDKGPEELDFVGVQRVKIAR